MSILARLFDKLVIKRFFHPMLLDQAWNNKLPGQYAFRPFASCECCLIALMDKLTEILSYSCNKYVVLISTDISKAFDMLNHANVLHALVNCNIEDNVYNWCISYLENHSQCTSFNNNTSPYLPINKGVIQGSSLGPILFIVAFSDLQVHSKINTSIMYADDIYIVIPSSNCHTLDAELLNFSSWAKEKGLSVNNDKLKIMCCCYDKGNHKLAVDGLGNIGHVTVNDMKILGINISHNLLFSKHISQTINKCNKIFTCCIC